MRENSLRALIIVLDVIRKCPSAVCSAQSEVFFRLLLKNTVCGTQKRLVHIFGKPLNWGTIRQNETRNSVLLIDISTRVPVHVWNMVVEVLNVGGSYQTGCTVLLSVTS